MISMTDAEKEKTVLFDESARYEFPENIVRVTAGKGGEALLFWAVKKRHWWIAEWHIVPIN